MERYEAHPFAAIFPMLSPDELADLATDIKEHGLKSPIVLGLHDGAKVIVDGRNRQEACEMAEVEPAYAELNGEDVKAFIVSKNVKRRHLNSGQRAMAIAMINPAPGKVGRKGNGSVAEPLPEVSTGRLSMARAVLHAFPTVADEIMAGTRFLDAEYPAAKAKLKEKQTIKEQLDTLRCDAPDLLILVTDSRITLEAALNLLDTRKADLVKLDLIRKEAPDLIALVDEGRMSVPDAMVAHAEREAREKNARRSATALFAAVMRLFDFSNADPEQEATRLMSKFDPLMWPTDELGVPNSQLFQSLATVFVTCAKIRKEQEKRK